MKIKTKAIFLASVAGSLLLAAGSAKAQNALHAPTDLVLTFQNPGGSQGASQTMIVDLGNIIGFRDGTPFTTFNIGSSLVSTFGSTWYDQSTLWMGAVGNRGTSTASVLGADLDPQRTLYVSQARNSIGTVGSANSVAPNVANDNTMTSAATGIAAVGQNLENLSSTLIGVVDVTTSAVDNQNPVSGGIQGLSYTAFASGVQDNFFAGSLGSFGTLGTIELALDLYRYQARNDIVGQYGFGDPTRQGEYLGTITINQAGDVNFTAAVPEPSTAMLLGAGLSMSLFMARRRRQVTQAA